MHTEIERKFIVTDSTFKESAVRIMDIRQGYIGTPSGKEVTEDSTYYNSTLSKAPWKDIQSSRAEAWDDWRDSLVKK